MFRLPNPPSPGAERHELADFAELLAWQNGSISEREIIALLGRDSDNSNNVGCDDDSDELEVNLDEVMDELERRSASCRQGYPFSLERNGNVLRFVDSTYDFLSVIYCYLLLCTRLNMRDNRIFDGLDGADMFEEVSAHVFRCYLGFDRSQSFVFGTSTPGGFEGKINALCQALGEGIRFRNRDQSLEAVDDKLDAVAWVPFTDGDKNKLVIFGQCKTGSTWGGLVTQLQPDEFIDLWMEESFLVDPVRAFCVAESVDRARWAHRTRYAGLFFDRCRLIDFCGDLPIDLLERIMRWTSIAHSSITL